MKLFNPRWIKEKYDFLSEDIKKKGIARAFSENIYEFINKSKFKKLGVTHPDFCENLDSTNSQSVYKDSHENQPSSFYSLNKAFRHLGIDYSNICLLDIGCGSGRVLSFGMLLKFKEVAGVDLDAPAIKTAIENCTLMNNVGYETSFSIDLADATTYKIPPNINVIYLFNPFGEKTMGEVIENLKSHIARSSDTIHIIYSNPKHRDLFMEIPGCKRIFESYYKDMKPDMTIFSVPPGAK